MYPVVYVYQDQYPWDVRVEKICGTLAEVGHEVTILSRTRTALTREERISRNLTIRRLSPGLGPISRNLINFPAFFSPFWFAEIVRTSKNTDAQMVVVRDLPLGLTAYWAGAVAGIPVVMDMAENYPAMIADTWRYGRVGPLDALIRNPRLLRILERQTLPRMNGVITVSKPSADRVREAVSSSTHVWMVGNTPVLRTGRARETPSALAESIVSTGGLRLLYVGGLEEFRGLDVVLRALSLLKDEAARVSLFVVGDGPSLPMLRGLAADLDIEEHVHFAGWLEPREVPVVTESADICLVPHYVTEHVDTTLPNKIFDYMEAGKPVIVSHSRTLRQIVESASCGAWYQDDRPEELAERIMSLRSVEARTQAGQRGREAVRTRFNWEIDKQRLLAGLHTVHSASGLR